METFLDSTDLQNPDYVLKMLRSEQDTGAQHATTYKMETSHKCTSVIMMRHHPMSSQNVLLADEQSDGSCAP